MNGRGEMPVTIKWKSPLSGNWDTAANWDMGLVPNSTAFDAEISMAMIPMGPYTVTILGGEAFAVHSLNVGMGTELFVGGTLTLGGGDLTVFGLLDGGSAAGAFIGGSGLLENMSLISANVAGEALYLFDSHLGLTVANFGSMEARNGGQLLIETPKFTNFTGHVLTGGSYLASGNGSVLAFWGSDAANASFTTNAADVTLDGAGSDIQSGAADSPFRSIESTLNTISNIGALHLLGARSYTPASAITVDGVFDLRGGTF